MAKTVSSFIFQKWEIIPEEGKILFHYAIDHVGEKYNFTETLILPKLNDLENIPHSLLASLLNSLLLILGISYWKLYCPKQMEIASFSLTKEQAAFWNTVYTKGLGEFFYNNKIDFKDLIHFPYDEKRNESGLAVFPRQNRSLLPVGGGKDSIVAGEMLKKMKKPFSKVIFYTGFAQNHVQENVAKTINVDEPLVIQRVLDKQLFILNKKADTYNGHIPAVAIYSFLSVFLAALYDYRYVVFANEASANYGNVSYLGEIVNHQWSKSWEFEMLFSDYINRYVTQDISYFSVLRPFSEIKIAKLFSQYPQYFPFFVSCNKGYTIAKKGNVTWCGKCAKCAFVFLLLAAFLSKKQVITIFARNLFDDASLLPLYRELLGLDAFKPFECIGTPEEVRFAFYSVWKKKEWEESVVMKLFVQDILPHMANVGEQEIQLFSQGAHHIPKEFSEVLHI